MREDWKFWIVFAKRNSWAFDAAIYHCVLAQFMAVIVRITMTAIFLILGFNLRSNERDCARFR